MREGHSGVAPRLGYDLPPGEGNSEQMIIGHNPARRADEPEHWFSIEENHHALIAGKTRTGKSTLLSNIIIQARPFGGLLVVDPHGPLFNELKAQFDLPFQFSRERTYPLNVFADADPALAIDAAWSLIEHIWEQYNAPQSEHLFKMCARALYGACPINAEETWNVPHLGLMYRFFTDETFRTFIITRTADEEAKSYFQEVYDKEWDKRMRAEKTAPLINKLGKFTDPLLKPIFCTSESYDFRKAIDEGQVMLFNLSLAQWGEDRAAFIGGVVGFKHQQALISRQDLLDAGKKPTPSYAFWDEFSVFLGTNISVYLAQAGKYGGYLTLATQVFSLLPDATRSTALGNCGSFIIYRVGSEDAELFAKEFGNDFPKTAIQWSNNYEGYLQTVLEGIPQTPVKFRAFKPGFNPQTY